LTQGGESGKESQFILKEIWRGGENMSVRAGDFYVKTTGDLRKYKVRAVSEIVDLVILESADGRKVLTTLGDFETLFIKKKTGDRFLSLGL
jgi:hypothetical protein